MKTALLAFAVLVAVLVNASGQQAQPAVATLTSTPTSAMENSSEINTTLMETTFLILGPSARAGEDDKIRSGTCFIMTRPSKAGGTTFWTLRPNVCPYYG